LGKNALKRISKDDALGIVQSSLARAQKQGLTITLVNIPEQTGMGIVIDHAWFCEKCIKFQFGKRSESMKCAKCEAKK
jgi:hypothetical protein